MKKIKKTNAGRFESDGTVCLPFRKSCVVATPRS